MKAIAELSIYYGLAIRRNLNSAEDKRNEILATLEHKSSTDDNPTHDRCPQGPDSWCKYRKAEAAETANSFRHPAPFTDNVQEVL